MEERGERVNPQAAMAYQPRETTGRSPPEPWPQ